MRILFTGGGSLAQEYTRVNSCVEVHSFRNMSDGEIVDVIRDAEVIVHNSAWIHGDDLANLLASNVGLTKRIVDIIKDTDSNVRFINIGSMSYLHRNGYLSVNKMTPYAYSKFLAEIYCLMVLKNIISVRFSSLFYKDPTRDILSKLIYSAKNDKKIILYNSGQAKRDYVPINIACQYLDYVIRGDMTGVIDICSGIETRFLEVGNILSKYLNIPITWEYMPTPTVLSKFTRVLPEIKFSLFSEIINYMQCVQ